MKRKRLKRAEIRRRKQGLALVAVGMAAVYLAVFVQGVASSTPAFITVALLLTQLFVIMGGVISLRWLRVGSFITLFSAVAVAFMFSTALGMYVPVVAAMLGALVYSLPHLTLGFAQWDLANRAALPPDDTNDTLDADVERLTLRDEAASVDDERAAQHITRGQRLRMALG
jgi:hypothetical protein